MQESPSLEAQAPAITATLLSASTTTGWLDWIHGELWLLPTGLLRIPLNLRVTLLHGMGPTLNPAHPTRRVFHEETLQSILTARKTVWVPRESIQKAYLHQGIQTDRLRLDLGDHLSVKFLWLPSDQAYQPLHAVLTQWLGGNLIVDWSIKTQS